MLNCTECCQSLGCNCAGTCSSESLHSLLEQSIRTGKFMIVGIILLGIIIILFLSWILYRDYKSSEQERKRILYMGIQSLNSLYSEDKKRKNKGGKLKWKK